MPTHDVLPVFMRVGDGELFEVGHVVFAPDTQDELRDGFAHNPAGLRETIAMMLRAVADEMAKPQAALDAG